MQDYLEILSESLEATLKMLDLAEKHGLTARRIHDARHAAIALTAGITQIYTYDIDDWKHFISDGLVISGPVSMVSQLTSEP
ncbi:hypothetical protein [Candidatus Parabeggiatoa sp. HSG14]|uniref:hypothetical protein n=1 Tax=Candidatus Parabeggiatoa sp. HSG14 TaxID=3055593 RepID=UPI0025A8562D|nr:PIN domain-containing protein [Thiotrichales bacterium HSG14]